MIKKILFLFTFLFASVVFAQMEEEKPREASKREIEIAKIDYELEIGIVTTFLRRCNTEISKSLKNNKPLHALEYFSYTNTLNQWLKYRWFIADTGFSRKWLKSVNDLLAYMCKTQVYLDAEKFNKRTKTAKYLQAVKYFDVAYKRFAKLLKKPVKVSSKVQRNAKGKKALWQKAMRKKYKIKEKIQADF